jgi:hypothetical protein
VVQLQNMEVRRCGQAFRLGRWVAARAAAALSQHGPCMLSNAECDSHSRSAQLVSGVPQSVAGTLYTSTCTGMWLSTVS